jgi:multidrug efflux system membrane fusion protein
MCCAPFIVVFLFFASKKSPRDLSVPGAFRVLSGCCYFTRMSTQKPPDGTTTTRMSFARRIIALKIIKLIICAEFIKSLCVESTSDFKLVATVSCWFLHRDSFFRHLFTDLKHSRYSMSKTKLGSLGLSLLIIIALIIWMATGETKVASTQPPDQSVNTTPELTRVQVQTLAARPYEPGVLLQGQLEPWYSVTISARASGTVETLKVSQGDHIQAGDVLLTLSDDGRQAMVTRWQARAKKLEADLAAGRTLRRSNLASQSELLGLESELAAANAELVAAKQTVANLAPKAPFDGTINRKDVDPGSLVQIGTPLFELVSIDRLKATAQIPQQLVSNVSSGQHVQVKLLGGKQLSGVVTFVASAADPNTRSFAVEIAVENPERLRVAGGSAGLRIALPEVGAMFISPAYLSLDDDGRPGVTYVGPDNRVVFGKVELLSVSTDGAWVSGLPEQIRLITRGSGFVNLGELVRPVDPSEDRG